MLTMTIQKMSSLSGTFQGCPENFQTVQKHSTLYEKLPHCLETFETVWKLSRPSKNFLDTLETFWWSGNFVDELKTLKLFRWSENFPDHLETSQTIQKLSRPSLNFPDHPWTFQTIRKLYCPKSFSGGGLYSSGNGLLLWSVVGYFYEVWLHIWCKLTVTLMVVWVLVYGSYIEVPNLGVVVDAFWQLLLWCECWKMGHGCF